jgi:hypothetical protein
MEIFESIPTWDNGTWTITDFSSREELSDFVFSIFKEPGKYNFDETSKLFNAESTRFIKDKIYTATIPRSKDFVTYWDDQNLSAEEELFLSPERRHGTLPETIICGLISCPYLIKNNKYLTLLKSGTHSTTWPYMNYLQSSTTNM